MTHKTIWSFLYCQESKKSKIPTNYVAVAGFGMAILWHYASQSSLIRIIVMSFWDSEFIDAESPFSLSEIEEPARLLINKVGLKYRAELSLLALCVYPLLTLMSLCYANLVHIFLWIVDDIVDNELEPHTLKERNLLVNLCRDTVKSYLNDSSVEPCRPKSLSSQHASVLQVLDYICCYDMLPILKQYLLHQMCDYFDGVQEHIAVDPQYRWDVKAFNHTRDRDGACEVVWPLLFLDDSPSDLYRHLAFMNSADGIVARRCATRNVSHVNDVLSIEKDTRNGTRFNIIFPIMQKHACCQSTAINICIDWSNDYYDELQQMRNASNAFVVDGLSLWCRASLKWHRAVSRYNEKNIVTE